MAWTTLVNSTTADATQVNDNYYWVRQGNLIPMAGASMGYTDAAHDLGGTPSGTTSTIRWRDAHLSRDLYLGRYLLTGPQTAGGINVLAGYIKYKGGEWPNSPTTTQIIIPPAKVEINGQIYYNNQTQTIVIATASDWVTSNANGLTNGTFTWVYAIPTSTGSWVAKIDDGAPVNTFSSLTSGLYHPGTGASGSTSYRAIHVIRSESTGNVMVKYWRQENWITYNMETQGANGWNTGPLSGSLTPYSFAGVPGQSRVKTISILAQNNPTSTAADPRINAMYVGNIANASVGTLWWQPQWTTFTTDDFQFLRVPANSNTVSLARANTRSGMTAYGLGYEIEF